jgi:hypothetical protein
VYEIRLTETFITNSNLSIRWLGTVNLELKNTKGLHWTIDVAKSDFFPPKLCHSQSGKDRYPVGRKSLAEKMKKQQIMNKRRNKDFFPLASPSFFLPMALVTRHAILR